MHLTRSVQNEVGCALMASAVQLQILRRNHVQRMKPEPPRGNISQLGATGRRGPQEEGGWKTLGMASPSTFRVRVKLNPPYSAGEEKLTLLRKTLFPKPR